MELRLQNGLSSIANQKSYLENSRLQKNSNLKTSVDLLYHGVVLYHDVEGLHIFANVEKGGKNKAKLF